jgi:hypothetical protein
MNRWHECSRKDRHRRDLSSSVRHGRWPTIHSSTRPCNPLLVAINTSPSYRFQITHTQEKEEDFCQL